MSVLEDDVCKIVEKTLADSKTLLTLSDKISFKSTMDNTPEWDSLAFVDVFLAVSEHFQVDVDEDDAISFTSIKGIVDLIVEIRDS